MYPAIKKGCIGTLEKSDSLIKFEDIVRLNAMLVLKGVAGHVTFLFSIKNGYYVQAEFTIVGYGDR